MTPKPESNVIPLTESLDKLVAQYNKIRGRVIGAQADRDARDLAWDALAAEYKTAYETLYAEYQGERDKLSDRLRDQLVALSGIATRMQEVMKTVDHKAEWVPPVSSESPAVLTGDVT